MNNKKLIRAITVSAGLGVVAGLRSMTAPAVLNRAIGSKRIRSNGGLADLLRDRRVEKIVSAMAVGELIFDKLPFVPDRTSFPSMSFRIVSGAAVGAALCSSKRVPVALGVVAGGVGAVAGTLAGYHLRKKLSEHAPGFLVAVAEDTVATGVGALLVRNA